MYKQKKALSLIVILLLSIGVEAKINIPVSTEKQKLCKEIYEKMANEHFFHDRDLSSINSEIFDAIVDQLDSQKIYFTKNEISLFRKKFSKFDNPASYQNRYLKPSLCQIDLKSKFTFINLYFNRLIEATNYQLKQITQKVLNSNQKTILFTIYNGENQRRYIGVKLD